MSDSVSFDILFRTSKAEKALDNLATKVDKVVNKIDGKFDNLDRSLSSVVVKMRTLNRMKFGGLNKSLETTNRQMASLTTKVKKVSSLMNNMKGASRGASALGNRFVSGGMGLLGGMGAYGLVGLIGGIPDSGNKMQSTMADVDGILDSSKKNYAGLRDQIIETGRASAFTITQMAGAAKYMAMAGMGGKGISESLGTVSNLAMVGNLDVDKSADIMTNIMAGMGISTASSGAVSDVISGVMTSTNVSVRELGQSFAYVGNIAAQTGRSVDEVGVAVGILGDAGIKGSRAGTNLRQMFVRLAKPTSAASKLIKDLKLELFEIGKSGKRQLKPISDLLGEFKSSGAGLVEFQTIFGIRGGTAFSSLISGADKYNDVLKKIRENGGGLTQSLAEKKMATTAGKTMIMKSKWEALSITLMEKVRPAYDFVVEGLGKLFDKLSKNSRFLEFIESVAIAIAKAFKIAYVIGKTLFGWIMDNGNTILNLLTSLGVAMAAFASYSIAASLVNPFTAMLIAGAGVLAMIDDIQGVSDWKKNAPDGAVDKETLAERYRGRMMKESARLAASGDLEGAGILKRKAGSSLGFHAMSDDDLIKDYEKDFSFHDKAKRVARARVYLAKNSPEGRMKKYRDKYLGGGMGEGTDPKTVLGQLQKIINDKDLLNLGGLNLPSNEKVGAGEGDDVGTLSSPLTSVANQMSRSVVVNMDALMKVENQYIGTAGGELSTEDIESQLSEALIHIVSDYELGMSH